MRCVMSSNRDCGTDPSGRGRQPLAKEGQRVERRPRFLVEAGNRSIDRAMHRAPVRHDPAPKAPIALQHAVQQNIVLAGIDAIHTVVGAHNGAGVALLDGDFKRQEVGFAQRRHVDPGVEHRAASLRVIEREMLDRRDHVLVLDAADRRANHRSGEQRVLTRIFEIATVARIAGEIDTAAENDVEALAPGLVANHRAMRIGQPRLPAGGYGEAGGKRRRLIGRAPIERRGDAEAAIGFPQRRDAEPGNALYIADHRLAVRRIDPALCQAQLFRGCHPGQHEIGAHIRRQHRVHPRPVVCRPLLAEGGLDQ